MVLNKATRSLVAFLYLTILTILFWLPGSAFPKQNWYNKIYLDKLVHFGVFALLALAWLWALQFYSKKQIVLLVLILTFYGFVTEAVQGLYIINRSFDLWDLISDFAGIIAGLIVGRGYIKK